MNTNECTGNDITATPQSKLKPLADLLTTPSWFVSRVSNSFAASSSVIFSSIAPAIISSLLMSELLSVSMTRKSSLVACSWASINEHSSSQAESE